MENKRVRGESSSSSASTVTLPPFAPNLANANAPFPNFANTLNTNSENENNSLNIFRISTDDKRVEMILHESRDTLSVKKVQLIIGGGAGSLQLQMVYSLDDLVDELRLLEDSVLRNLLKNVILSNHGIQIQIHGAAADILSKLESANSKVRKNILDEQFIITGNGFLYRLLNSLDYPLENVKEHILKLIQIFIKKEEERRRAEEEYRNTIRKEVHRLSSQVSRGGKHRKTRMGQGRIQRRRSSTHRRRN
jgi:hypothetical protein